MPLFSPSIPSSQANPNLWITLQNVYETFAICWPTTWEGMRNQVDQELCNQRLGQWSHRVVSRCKATVEIRGREHMQPRTVYLVMSNHESYYDIPFLFYAVGPRLRMLAKKELFRIPFFGSAMRGAGFIAIDRQHRKKALDSLQIAQQMLERGVHVWISPEGTRNHGSLLPFKQGGFHLAMQSKIPILPITLQGTRDILPRRHVRSRGGIGVDITIHPPINPLDYGSQAPKKSARQLAEAVRQRIEAPLL
ncbi:lysophospholipid acyltransferase family protein [Pajaroellobacter abortibovis]|uniref:1-acyl-sn-glycerol-3-phosphate acyltransferase n=1 Tax=Pajaroellobacter abortibovis TaxID=1882918 RepID=A0A1L6MX32_9BACT|nr:lysophospholipid acyltransferase family protein [Pajaroellobacter abortibovis]APS00094.1 hypothetical protein BCY86_04925 [Pajaroellobacter abortibovis]